ncbi:hypothetical protein D3C87_1203700 [compost metagenome]
MPLSLRVGVAASSVTAAAASAAPIVGASLVPVMVTSICRVTTPPCWSFTVMVKLSTRVWPAARYSTAVAFTV